MADTPTGGISIGSSGGGGGGWGVLAEGGEATNQTAINLIQSYYLEKAIRRAEKEQLKAADIAEQIVKDYGEAALEYFKPYLTYGTSAMNQLEKMEATGYFAWDQPQPDYGTWQEPQFKFETEPGYAFRALEGQRALESSAAARGMGLSGATQRAQSQYAQNMASQEYQNAWNRYMQMRQQGFAEFTNLRNFLFSKYNADYSRWLSERQATQNRLGAAAGMGYSASTASAGLKAGMGDTLSSLALRRGDIRAGKYVALGNLAAQTWYNQGMINDQFMNNAGAITGIGVGGESYPTSSMQIGGVNQQQQPRIGSYLAQPSNAQQAANINYAYPSPQQAQYPTLLNNNSDMYVTLNDMSEYNNLPDNWNR